MRQLEPKQVVTDGRHNYLILRENKYGMSFPVTLIAPWLTVYVVRHLYGAGRKGANHPHAETLLRYAAAHNEGLKSVQVQYVAQNHTLYADVVFGESAPVPCETIMAIYMAMVEGAPIYANDEACKALCQPWDWSKDGGGQDGFEAFVEQEMDLSVFRGGFDSETGKE